MDLVEVAGVRLLFYIEHRCGHQAQVKLRVKLRELDKLRQMRAEPCSVCRAGRVKDFEQRERELPAVRIAWWHWPTAKDEASSAIKAKVRALCEWAEERGSRRL